MYSVIASAAAAFQQHRPAQQPQQVQHVQQQQGAGGGSAARAGGASLNADELQWLSYTFDITSLTSPESKAGVDVFTYPERAPGRSSEGSDDGVPTRPQALGGLGGGGGSSGTKRAMIERKRSSDGAGFRESVRPAKLLSPTNNAPPHRATTDEIASSLTGTPHSLSGTSDCGASVEMKTDSVFAPSHYYGDLSPTYYGDLSPTYFVPDAAQQRSRWGKRPLAVDTREHSGHLPAAYQQPVPVHVEPGMGLLSMQQLHEHGMSPSRGGVQSESGGVISDAAAAAGGGGSSSNNNSININDSSNTHHNNQGDDDSGGARLRDDDVDYDNDEDDSTTTGGTPRHMRDPRARSRSVSMGQHDGGLLSPGQLSSSWSGPVPGTAFFAGPERHDRYQHVPQHRDTLKAKPGEWQPALAPGAGGCFFAGPERHHRYQHVPQHRDTPKTEPGEWQPALSPGAGGGGGASTGLGLGAGTPSAAAAAMCSSRVLAGDLSRPGTAEGAGAQARTPRLRCGSYESTSSNASCGSSGSATALFSPDSAAAARRKVKAGDEGCAQGRWKLEEVGVLLRIAELYYYGELKLIGEVCRFCGLNRPSRAIDKQLKRLLHYDKWSSRSGDVVLEQIRRLLANHNKLGQPEISARLAEATIKWPVPDKDDKKFKARGTDDLAGELFEQDDE